MLHEKGRETLLKDLREETARYWDLPPVHIIWPEILDRYKQYGFITDALPEEYFMEFFKIRDLLWDFVTKLKVILESQDYTPYHWSLALDDIMAKRKEKNCDRWEIIYRTMRDDIMQSLYITIADVAASNNDGTESEEYYE